MTAYEAYVILSVVGINYPEDDSKLVEGCINRDLAAWAKLVKKYSKLMFISIENRLKKYGFHLSSQDLEDIHQNTLTGIWKDEKLKTIKNRQNVSYWLAMVSGNMAIEHVRKMRSSEEFKSVSLSEKIEERELIQLIPSTQRDPIDELTRNELSRKIDTAIELLPSKERLIIKLHLLHEKKYEEISDILNIPYGTVSSYIKRTKEKLRTALKDFK